MEVKRKTMKIVYSIMENCGGLLVPLRHAMTTIWPHCSPLGEGEFEREREGDRVIRFRGHSIWGKCPDHAMWQCQIKRERERERNPPLIFLLSHMCTFMCKIQIKLLFSPPKKWMCSRLLCISKWQCKPNHM